MAGTTSSIRTSQQGWIEERIYRFPVTDTYIGWDYNGTFHTTEEVFDLTTPEYPSNVQDYLIIQDKLVYGVTKRIELATKLVLDRPYASESYQVANYGLGGQYAAHFDGLGIYPHPGKFPNVKKEQHLWYSLIGDRYATFMAYLSTVEVGGGTVFPLMGIGNHAVAGDALFWNNIQSDGSINRLSIHGGCPTLVGSKWITNKWILYYDNYRGSPCELERFKQLNTFDA